MAIFFDTIVLQQLLTGNEDWIFLIEVAFRTFFMFAVILTTLSILGKRGVKQLSIFELVIIIGLGSAAGDPMFYKDVGIATSLVVFIMIIGLYKLTTFITIKSERIENLIEGKAIYLIVDGRFAIEKFKKEPLGYDEFFAELRQLGVSHLGQVDLGILETSGEVSLYYYPDNEVKYGLPVLPHLYATRHRYIEVAGIYSCSFCGQTANLEISPLRKCPVCAKDEWVSSINTIRIK